MDEAKTTDQSWIEAAQAEAALKRDGVLRDNEQRWQAILEASSDGYWEYDLVTGAAYVSPRMWSIVGYQPGEFDPQQGAWRQLLHPDDVQTAEQAFNDHLTGRTPHYESEHRLRTKSGKWIWVLDRGKIIKRDAHGAPLRMAGAYTDITDRKRIDQVRTAIYLISEAVRTARDLDELYCLTHDIINDLMPARNFYIALYDAAADLLSFPYYCDEFDQAWPPQKPGRGLTSYVMRTGQPQLVTPGVFDQLKRAGQVEIVGTPAVDWLGVPLKARHEILGVMVVQTYTEDTRLSEDDKDLLVLISSHVALAIDHKRAEDALRQSEEFNRAVIEHSPVGISVRSRAGQLLSYNAAWQRIWAISPDTLVDDLTRPRSHLVFDDRDSYLGGWLPAVKRVYEHGGVLSVPELKTDRVPPNAAQWVSQHFYAITDAHGRVDRVVILTEDITERKRAAEAERDQRALAEALRDTATALSRTLNLDEVLDRIIANVDRVVPHDATNIMLIDPQRDFAYVARSRGYSDLEAVLARRYPLHDLPSTDAILKTGEVVIIADTHAHPQWVNDPEANWVRSYVGAPIRAQGEIIGFLNLESATPNFFTQTHAERLQAFADQAALAVRNARLHALAHRHADELEERVAERTRELERQRARMQAILDGADEGIQIMNPDQVIEYVNPATEKLTGFTAAEVLGQTARVWQTGPTSPATLTDLRRHLDDGETWRGEVVGRRKNGALYDVALTVSPLRGADDQIIGYVAMNRDITRLKELDRLKNQFVSRIGHELRTPIANIKLYIDLLERGKPDKRDDYMHTLRREVERLRRLIDGFLEISQLDAGMLPIHLMPIDLNRLVGNLIVDQSAVAAERGLTLTAQRHRDLPAALADVDLITQVVGGLLENAINYTPRDGRITITTEVREDLADFPVSSDGAGDSGKNLPGRQWVTLTVRDTGPGISPKELPRVFERFYRGEAARNYAVPGAGLSLAIGHMIMEKLGGRITVESAAGDGTAFTLWLRPA